MSMTAEEFDATLTRLKHHKPFIAFIVEMDDGRQVVIERPQIAFDSNGATYIKPGFELVQFCREEVKAMRHVPKEMRPAMTPDEFDQTLRDLVNADRFRPFLVEMRDGRRFNITGPHVAFGGGSAAFIAPDVEEMFEFAYTDVRRIHPAPQEVVP